MTAEQIAAAEHKRENCPFYPACYIAGDCDQNDWETHDCGLPAEVKEAKHREWLARLRLDAARRDLIEAYTKEVRAGAHDHQILERQGK